MTGQTPTRHPLARFLKSFRDDTRGSVSVELVLMAPLLFWTLMAVYTYFDGYRQSAVNLKAAYTISDLISRETEAIDDNYIDSMHNLLQLMTRSRSATSMRVSVVRWDEDDARYYVIWSTVRDRSDPLTDGNVSELAERLPTMPDNDIVILVETGNTFVPLFRQVGLKSADLKNFVFTRPRFAPQVVWQS